MDISSVQQAVSGAQSPSNQLPKDPDLGMFDFLKLLTTQLSHQDPLNPIDDTDFIAQMAQFSSLQEMSRMNNQVGQLREDQLWISAQQFIGNQVVYTDDSGVDQSGKVHGTDREGEDIFLRINEDRIPISSVHQVQSTNGSQPDSQ